MHNGLADPATLSEQAEQADVVILVETTPPALKALKPDGDWDQRFPYSIGDPRDDVSNTAVYSRLPLSPGTLLGRTSFQQWDASRRGARARQRPAAGRASVQPLLRRRSVGD